MIHLDYHQEVWFMYNVTSLNEPSNVHWLSSLMSKIHLIPESQDRKEL